MKYITAKFLLDIDYIFNISFQHKVAVRKLFPRAVSCVSNGKSVPAVKDTFCLVGNRSGQKYLLVDSNFQAIWKYIFFNLHPLNHPYCEWETI